MPPTEIYIDRTVSIYQSSPAQVLLQEQSKTSISQPIATQRAFTQLFPQSSQQRTVDLNVIRYYYQEAHARFLYIVLKLCLASLADLIETPDRDAWRDITVGFDPKRVLKQVTNRLRHAEACTPRYYIGVDKECRDIPWFAVLDIGRREGQAEE
ncbi:hypothetical protein P691DRAFT_773395 [Macrolepiota fuliginosa MF-IS2]|uniref:Uncharacterized protein n=1 Tax=Macrolepiota fuliginosa MF-IS2 TaxID=1400762 RepID=A0A9P5XHM6_9AGAR|nr:hypothetical protein P691DRAFT_773395 [Macrolepiota fuliginosa MF-IS2]